MIICPLKILLLLFIVLAITVGTTADTASHRIIQSVINDIQLWQAEYAQQQTTKGNSDVNINGGGNKPFVTVTYAQSIDGKIALLSSSNLNTSPNQQQKDDDDDDDNSSSTTIPSSSSSSNFAISDPQSLIMTHALRSIHDAILVGGNTLSVDNPRLNNRLWSTTMTATEENDNVADDDSKNDSRASSIIWKQPRPVVLDTHLNHINKLGKANCAIRATNILVCCSSDAAATCHRQDLPDTVELLECPLDKNTGRMDLPRLLQLLKEKHDIQSVMVEGGASVLSAFYYYHCQQQQQQPSERSLIDCLCITVSPQLLLWRGLSSIQSISIMDATTTDGNNSNPHFILNQKDFASSKFLLLGRDSIFLANLAGASSGGVGGLV